ncbi:MAG: class I SAM-dependent methyltransferase [Thermodesulfobacteriota bacterium]
MTEPPAIDWAARWRQARHSQSWQGKSAADWNRRSAAFARRHLTSPFADRLLPLLPTQPDWTVLDIGCGPGTLALPLSPRVQRITAIDFSASMLAILRRTAEEKSIGNIRTVEAGWDDPWPGVGAHDLVLASRALAVDDITAALDRIDRLAQRCAVIVERVGAGPFDPDIFAAVGRSFSPGPDYLYLVNLLYEMGIQASVAFIEPPATGGYASEEEAYTSSAWMLEEMTGEEEQRLRLHLKERLRPTATGLVLERRTPVRWAVLSWRRDGMADRTGGPDRPPASSPPPPGPAGKPT